MNELNTKLICDKRNQDNDYLMRVAGKEYLLGREAVPWTLEVFCVLTGGNMGTYSCKNSHPVSRSGGT